MFRKIKSDADRQHLQDDLNKLIEWIEWSAKWQMLFNFGKCECLHTGHGNEDAQYTMGGTVLNTTVKEKDLGLTISADMKVSEQCGIAAAKGNQILGLIRRNIVYNKIGPCGTPLKTDFQFEITPSTTTICVLSISHFSIQLIILFPMPWSFRLSSNVWCGTLSKAF